MTGYLAAIDAFKAKKWLGIMYITGALAWTAETILVLVVFKMVYSDFRGK
jgi:hypothetical protein